MDDTSLKPDRLAHERRPWEPTKPGNNTSSSPTPGCPPCDSWETSDHHVLSLDVPGLAQADFRVTFTDGKLTVAGNRRNPRLELGKHHERLECQHGTFERTFEIPGHLDVANISATYHEGVLQVVLPKLTALPIHEVTVREVPHCLAAPVTEGWDTEDEDCDTCLG